MQQQDKIKEFVFTHRLASVMNRTKWREVAAQMISNPDFNPRVRVKYLFDEQPSGFNHQWWDWVKTEEAREIEWMEISPIALERVGWLVEDIQTDFSTWVRQALSECSIPFTEQNGIFRINGCLRPNQKL